MTRNEFNAARKTLISSADGLRGKDLADIARQALLNTARRLGTFTASQAFYVSHISEIYRFTAGYSHDFCMDALRSLISEGLVIKHGWTRGGSEAYKFVG
jgi:hypothetical protein